MTILLEIAVVAAIVYGLVAWGLGGLGGMRSAPPDSGEVGLPEGRLAPAAIDGTRFGLAFRGYRMSEVDEVLDRLRDEVAARDHEVAVLRGEVPPDSPAPDAGPAGTVSDDEAAAGRAPAASRPETATAEAPLAPSRPDA